MKLHLLDSDWLEFETFHLGFYLRSTLELLVTMAFKLNEYWEEYILFSLLKLFERYDCFKWIV